MSEPSCEFGLVVVSVDSFLVDLVSLFFLRVLVGLLDHML